MTTYTLPNVKSWVVSVANEVGNLFGIKTIGGWRATDSVSQDHPNGVALDFMTTQGTALAEYLVANANRLGTEYVVWNRHIWSRKRASEGWRPYTGSNNPHTDHVHGTFSAKPPLGGAVVNTAGNLGTQALGGLFDLDGLMNKVRGTSITLLGALLGVGLIGAGIIIAVRQTTARIGKNLIG